MNTVTRLWHIGEDGKRRLMNTIDAGSVFFGFPSPRNLHLEEQRVKAAEILRDGWINQGRMRGKFIIEHGKPDQRSMSKMTEELMTRRKDFVF